MNPFDAYLDDDSLEKWQCKKKSCNWKPSIKLKKSNPNKIAAAPKSKRGFKPQLNSTFRDKKWKPLSKFVKKSRKKAVRKIKPIKSFKTIRNILYKGDKNKIKMIDNESFKLMLNVLANILNEEIIIKPKLFKKMYKHKRIFRRLVDPRNTIDKSKKIVANQKGGILPIFAALIPLIAAAAPLIGKAALGIGAAAAGTAASAAIAKKING
jgi:hypothetical protein